MSKRLTKKLIANASIYAFGSDGQLYCKSCRTGIHAILELPKGVKYRRHKHSGSICDVYEGLFIYPHASFQISSGQIIASDDRGNVAVLTPAKKIVVNNDNRKSKRSRDRRTFTRRPGFLAYAQT